MLQLVKEFPFPFLRCMISRFLPGLAYVHSVMDTQTNLHLRTNSRVSRVIFEGNKAVGVAYVPARNRAHKGARLETIVRVRKDLKGDRLDP